MDDMCPVWHGHFWRQLGARLGHKDIEGKKGVGKALNSLARKRGATPIKRLAQQQSMRHACRLRRLSVEHQPNFTCPSAVPRGHCHKLVVTVVRIQ